MKYSSILLLIILISPLYAQVSDGKWTASGWNNLVIDATSAEAAIQLLGKPEKDKVGRLPERIITPWLSPRQNEKIFRTLSWRHKAEAEEIILSFDDDKLVFINVALKEYDSVGRLIRRSPDELETLFRDRFLPVAYSGNLLMPRERFDSFLGDTREKLVKDDYSMVAIADKSFILAAVSDTRETESTFGVFDPAKARNANRRDNDLLQKLPGQVMGYLIVSRALEAHTSQ